MGELVDAYGRPIKTELLKEPQAAPEFQGIRNIYSAMHPSIGLTPERLAAILRQSEWGDPLLALELFQDMEEKDLHYLAVLGTRKQTVAQLELAVRPAGKDAEALADAEFVREVLLNDDGLALRSSFADMSDAIGKGFACMEIMWGDGSDGSGGLRWVPDRIAWRDPRWFMFDWISGEQVLVRTWRNEQTIDQQNPWSEKGWQWPTAMRGFGLMDWSPDLQRIGIQPATAPLIPFKFITHIAKAKSGLPIRGGLSRAVAWIYLFKNYVLKDWVTYAERYGMPARLGRYPTGATDDDKNVLLRACAQLGSDAAAIIPEAMKVELLEAEKSGRAGGADVFAAAAHYFDDSMSKAVLGQTLTTEIRDAGSRAATEVHDQVRRDILQWDAVRVSESLSRDLVQPMVALNRGPRRRYPHLTLKITAGADKIWMDMVGTAADHGVKIGQDAVRDHLGIPAPLEGEALLTPKQQVRETEPITEPSPTPPAAPPRPAGAHASRLDPPTLARVARVVVMDRERVCVVAPRGEPYVMLPGGHLEPEETFEAAAVREVREETGLDVELTAWVADFTDERAHRRYYAGELRRATHRAVVDGDGSGVNDVQWLSIDDARDVLTSEYDRAAVEKWAHGTATRENRRQRTAHARRRPAARTEEYARRMAADAAEALEPLVDRVRNHIANARSLADARDRLHELVDEMDTSHFEDRLQRATFAVRAAANTRTPLP